MSASHPNFQSIVSGVYSADDIDDMVGGALIYQYMFDKRTSPWEMSEWEEGELDNFRIDSQDIDRLYHIYNFDDGVADREFELLARMDYKGRPVYVQMSAGCDFTGFECQGGGDIYLSFDAQVFLKSIVKSKCNPHYVWKSMTDDGLIVEEPTEFDNLPPQAWNNVPMLQYLCNRSVYDEQDKLQHYDEVLPHPISASVQEYMKIRDTRDHYENCF